MVTQASLTVTANDAAWQLGAASPRLTYTITGFVNADTSAVVSGTASLTTTATATSAVGTYPITFSTKSLTAANYTFRYTSGTLTVYSTTSPFIVELSSSAATAGGAGFTLTVNGANFASKSVVLWNGAVRKTTYVSAAQLTAAIGAADIAKEKTNLVTVANPAPNPATAAAMPFVVMSSAPVATITGGSLAATADGSGNRLLTLAGRDFLPSSTVRWNGASLATTDVSPWQISAVLPASGYSSLPAVVTVQNPAAPRWDSKRNDGRMRGAFRTVARSAAGKVRQGLASSVCKAAQFITRVSPAAAGNRAEEKRGYEYDKVCGNDGCGCDADHGPGLGTDGHRRRCRRRGVREPGRGWQRPRPV